MHDLVLDLILDRPAAAAPLALVRMPLDGGALIACFDSGSPTGPPRWVAKTGHGAQACERLRAEARALGLLEPFARQLRVPRLLGWREGPEDTDGGDPIGCLAQSGLPGRPAAKPSLEGAASWLQQFQLLATTEALPVARPKLVDLAVHLVASARTVSAGDAKLAPLLDPLMEQVHRAPADASGLSAIPIHGDFWAGNVLFEVNWRGVPCRPAASGVLDWSGFGFGSPLYDLFTWLATESRRLDGWERNFLHPGAARNLMRAWAERWEYRPPTARWAFYLFLLRRIGWELGFDLQARSPLERDRARRHWNAALSGLRLRDWPDPFTD